MCTNALHLYRLGDVILRIVTSGRPLVHIMGAWSTVAPHLVEVRSNPCSQKHSTVPCLFSAEEVYTPAFFVGCLPQRPKHIQESCELHPRVHHNVVQSVRGVAAFSLQRVAVQTIREPAVSGAVRRRRTGSGEGRCCCRCRCCCPYDRSVRGRLVRRDMFCVAKRS